MNEAEQTERVITGLIMLLLVVAALLTVLTIWYWRHTSPKRRARDGHRGQTVDLDGVYGQGGAERTLVQQAVSSDGYGHLGPRN